MGVLMRGCKFSEGHLS